MAWVHRISFLWRQQISNNRLQAMIFFSYLAAFNPPAELSFIWMKPHTLRVHPVPYALLLGWSLYSCRSRHTCIETYGNSFLVTLTLDIWPWFTNLIYMSFHFTSMPKFNSLCLFVWPGERDGQTDRQTDRHMTSKLLHPSLMRVLRWSSRVFRSTTFNPQLWHYNT